MAPQQAKRLPCVETQIRAAEKHCIATPCADTICAEEKCEIPPSGNLLGAVLQEGGSCPAGRPLYSRPLTLAATPRSQYSRQPTYLQYPHRTRKNGEGTGKAVSVARLGQHLQSLTPPCPLQTVSKRVANAKSGKFHQNIHKRGAVEAPDPKVSSAVCATRPARAHACSPRPLNYMHNIVLTRLPRAAGRGLVQGKGKISVGPVMLGFFLFVVVGSGGWLHRLLVAHGTRLVG